MYNCNDQFSYQFISYSQFMHSKIAASMSACCLRGTFHLNIHVYCTFIRYDINLIITFTSTSTSTFIN